MTPILITLPISLLLAIGVVNSWYLEKERPPNELNYPDLYDIPIIYDDGVNEEYNNEINKNVEPFKSEDLKQKKSGPYSTKQCTVKKRTIILPEDGFEYIPKHYHDYECIPVSENNRNNFANQNACHVMDTSCDTLEKILIVTRESASASYCFEHYNRTIKVGCDCLKHIKFGF